MKGQAVNVLSAACGAFFASYAVAGSARTALEVAGLTTIFTAIILTAIDVYRALRGPFRL